MAERVALPRTAEERAEEAEFLELYGAWTPWTPGELQQQMVTFEPPWWIVGGWAIEAATGLQREHEDLDMSILACDVAEFVRFMNGRLHVWNNVGGVLHPLGQRWPDVDEPQSQLWLRKSAKDPWLVDIPITPDVEGRWTNKRIANHVAELDEVTWQAADGIRYLLPEIALVYKATQCRPKDELDLDATLPKLSPARREWLRNALTELTADHPWLARL